MKNLNHSEVTPKLSSFTGVIDYPFTNDYMFRSVLQSNKKVLKGLLCSLMSLKPEDVHSVHILNPIELGGMIENKDFILDIKVIMNNNTIINLELQMNNQYNWPERSLSYLCRLYDGLNSGEKYGEARPAFQIGILNFTLFAGSPEFFSTYKMMNVKNYQNYSDKFTIHVLDLTKVDLATKEDKDYELDKWAKLFNALTWEEFKMIAEGNESMREAGETMFTLNWDDQVRYQCEARERYYREWNEVNHLIEELKTENAEKESTIAEKESIIVEKEATIARLEAQVAELKQQMQENKGGEQIDQLG